MKRKLVTQKDTDKFIELFKEGKNFNEIGKILGFNSSTVNMHLTKLGYYKPIKNKLTLEEKALIEKMYKEGTTILNIESELDRSFSTILKYLKDVGIFVEKRNPITEEELEILKKFYPIGDFDSLKTYFPNRTRQSLQTIASTYGIEATYYQDKKWTFDEIEILKEYYPFYNLKDVYKMFNGRHTFQSMITKANKSGIVTRDYWSDEEKKLLIDNYENNFIDDITYLFPKRSRDSVILMANKLKIKSCTFWREEEDEFIKNNWELMPDIIMSKNMNRTFRSVKWRREELGLFRQDKSEKNYSNIASYIRTHINDWKKQSMKECDYKCVLTGDKNFDIHHLYSVCNILKDVFEDEDIIKKDVFEDYTDNELEEIVEKFKIIQSKYPLGVCVSRKLHTLFHSLYGSGNNYPEQWYRFVCDYNNGIYNEYIK